MKSAAADSGWRMYPQLHLIRPATTEKVAWRDLIAKVEIQKNGGVVHSAAGYELPTGAAWRGKGTWLRDGDFNGTVKVNGGSKRAQNFTLHGEKGALTVENELGASR
jgi:hypothetical protein